MHVVINSECSTVPDDAQSISAAGNALLNFLMLLGYDPCNPPVADVLRRLHHLDGDWVAVSPIHWQATHNDAMIVALDKDLDLQESEAKLSFDLFAEYLAVEDWVLYYHSAELWLLCDPKKCPLNAKPPQQLLNKSLMPELAQLDKTMHWQKFFTESQMFFASNPDQSVLNGVWAWGGSKLSNPKTLSICADKYFLPIAQQCSTKVTLYNPLVSLRDYEILLVNDFADLSVSHQEELKKMSVEWYWNNAAYTSNSSWFTRMWRKLIHAH